MNRTGVGASVVLAGTLLLPVFPELARSPSRLGPLLGAPAARAAGLGPALKSRKCFPAAGTFDVTTDAVAVQFSQPLDPATVTPSVFTLRTGGIPLPGTVAVVGDRKGRRAVFTPKTSLPAGASFTLTVTTGLRSARGRELEEQFRLDFITSPAKPVTEVTPVPEDAKLRRVPRLGPPPKVIYTYPAVGLGNVFSDEVVIRFSRTVLSGTVDDSSFALLQGGRAVEGTIGAVEGSLGREYRFDPAQPLYPDSTFEIRVTRAVLSDRGRPLKEEFHGAFGTSPFKEGILPLEPQDFTAGPLLFTGRAFHTATPLDDGRLLVVGGQAFDGTSLDSAETFHPDETFFRNVGSMSNARRFHAAVLLRNGTVLVTGGFGATNATLGACEIFDPVTNSWSETAPMMIGRANHTATLLPDGKVLVAGGFSRDTGTLLYTGRAETYDPLTGIWTPLTDMVAERGAHTATLLDDGRVLLTGGARFGLFIAETFDYRTRTFTETAGKPLSHRQFHAAAKTKSGTVLLAGGGPGTAEQFVPSSGHFASAGASTPRGLPVSESPHYATLDLITLGRVMFLGGISFGGAPGGGDLALSQVQLWDAKGSGGAGAFFPMVFDLAVPRAGHTVSRLSDGTWMIIGGLGVESPFNERRTMILRP